MSLWIVIAKRSAWVPVKRGRSMGRCCLKGLFRAMQKDLDPESLRRMKAHMCISPTEVGSDRELYIR